MSSETPKWVVTYRWPETFRFKHLRKFEPFRLYGRTFVRISARRYVPADVHLVGLRVVCDLQDRPVKCIESINTPVNTYVF